MKSLKVPLVNFEEKDLDSALELCGARFDVDQQNWPEDWPYAPICCGRIARSNDALIVDFRVSGLDLLATNLQDNGRQWEDSCVEVFIQDPDESCYYNFEMNALGKILACSGADRSRRTARGQEEMEEILRFAQYDSQKPLDEEGLHNWRAGLVIPFELIGIDPENLPEKIRANFYKCGDKTAHPHFLSWSPIKTDRPDFHRPEFFGELILG